MYKLSLSHKYLLARIDAPEGMRVAGIGPSISEKDKVEIFLIGDGTHDVKEINVE